MSRLFLGSVFVASVLVASSLQAAVNIFTSPNPIQQTSAIDTHVATGATMKMKVTATFSDGSVVSGEWGPNSSTGLDANDGSVILSTVSVTEGNTGFLGGLFDNGDTYFDDWTVTNSSTTKSLTKLVFDGGDADSGNGNTVFDRFVPPAGLSGLGQEGTPGSDVGLDFAQDGGNYSGNMNVTYGDEVELTGHSPVGDIWRTLTIDFQNTFKASGSNSATLNFQQDTDLLMFAGDIRQGPGTGANPEASSFVIWSVLGGIGLVISRRRFRSIE